MHTDDFGAFGGGFDHFDGGFGQAVFEGHVFDGYLDDAHTVAVDPYAESFNLATADPTAISIRLQREQLEQFERTAQDAQDAMLERAMAAERWVACVVRGEPSADEGCVDDVVDDKELRWEIAERLSGALANQLGYDGKRDLDCWMRPTREEWLHMPAGHMRIYNDAYARFVKLIGKRLPVDRAMTAEEWQHALDHEAMLLTQAALDAAEPIPVPRRLRIILS